MSWRNTILQPHELPIAVGIALCLVLSLYARPAEVLRQPRGLRVLILSGLNNHEWQKTTPVLVTMFRNCDRFDVVDVSEQPGNLNAKVLAKYDVIVSNWTPYPDTSRIWPGETEKAFLNFLNNGGGFVVFHAASCSFQVWPEFQKVVAMTWKADHTAHGAYHTFKVVIEDKNHPITQAMPDFYVTDELYHNMVLMAGGKLNVTAMAFSSKDQGGTGKFEPVLVWTQVGKGRGVNLVLGHDVKAMQTGFRTLLLRSAEWAATGNVTIPVPTDWPITATIAVAETIDLDGALKAASDYTAGRDPRFVYDIEQLVIAANSRTDAEAVTTRNALAAKIANALASNLTPAAKMFLCKSILTIASKDQIPLLAPLLIARPNSEDARVADAARGVIQVIPGPAADDALLDALDKTSGPARLGIIESLGERRSSQAVGVLISLLNGSDAATAAAAACALGKIGGTDAERKLSERLSTAEESLRLYVAEAYLRNADRRLRAGELIPATAMYTKLFVPSEALPIREAALRGLVFSDPQKGIPLSLEALNSSEPGMQRTALQLIRELPGNAGTTVITDQISRVAPSMQIVLLEALAERGDLSAIPTVEKMIKSEDEVVRTAALKTIEILGGERSGMDLEKTGLRPQQLIHHPKYAWQQTEDSIALRNHDRTVWKFNFGKDTSKPYFHPVALLDGTVLTCLSPRDHPWHRGLWFSWTKLNGLNYWEEDPKSGLSEGLTEVEESNVNQGRDYSARIQMNLTYHPLNSAPLLREKRTISISPPDKDGSYRIDWEGIFTAEKQDVQLQGGTAGGGYAGMSVRISQDTKEWRLIDSDGRADLPGGPIAKNTHGQKARWMDFSLVDATTGQIGGIAILQHPRSFRYPSHWHNVMDDKFPFGYFSPAPLWAEPYALTAGKSLTVHYRIFIHPGRGSKDQLDDEWKAFSESAK